MADDDKPPTEAVAALAERQWPFVLKLKHPVEFGKECIEYLEFRRGSLGDLKALKLDMDRTPHLDHLLTIASRLCGKSTKVIESLEGEDSAAVVEIALVFFARCLGAGTTP